MPLDYEFIDRMPTMAEMVNGQSIIDTTSRGGRLTEYLKYNGQIFTQDFTSLSSQAQQVMFPGMNGTSSGFESDAGFLEWDGEDDTIRVYDSGADLRVKVGHLSSTEYGIALYNDDGDTVLAKFNGSNAHIGNWWINENYIQGDDSSGTASSNYIKLDSQNRRVEIKDASNVRAQLGKIGATAEYGLKLWDNTGSGVLAAIHGSTATIAGWDIGTTSLSAGDDADFIGLSTTAGIQLGDSTFGDAKFSVTPAGVLKAVSGLIANLTISTSALYTGAGYNTSGTMYFGSSGLSLSDVFKVDTNGELTSTSGSIGGWFIDTATLRSVDSATSARIELNKTNNRIGVWGAGAGNEIVAMGYLNGLEKNIIRGFMTDRTIWTMTDSTATWATNEHAGATVTEVGGVSRTVVSNTATVITVNSTWDVSDGDAYEISGRGDYGASDYGFWAKPGDNLFIDGDVQYNNGDWIIAHDASYLVQNSDSTPKTIIRLGTDTGEKGLFLYETDGTTIAKFHNTGFTMGSMGGSDNYIDFDTVSGTLAVKGSITVDESSLDLNDNFTMHQLRLVLNVHSDDGASQNGEFALVLRGSDNSPTYGSSGKFTWKGTEYTLPWNEQAADVTCHTNVANKKGYICYETDGGGNAFEVNSTDTDLAFVYLDGSTWKYDKNNTGPATFVPTETMVALGHIHTHLTTPDGELPWGNLFEPRQLLDINNQVNLNSSGMKLKNAAGTVIADYGATVKIYGGTGLANGTYTEMTATALDVYASTSLGKVASFGTTTTIGKQATGYAHISLSDTEMAIWDDENKKMLSAIDGTLTVGHHATSKLVVDGDAGTMTMGDFSVDASGDISVTGGTFTGAAVSAGSISGGTISGTAISGGTISATTFQTSASSSAERVIISTGGELEMWTDDGTDTPVRRIDMGRNIYATLDGIKVNAYDGNGAIVVQYPDSGGGTSFMQHNMIGCSQLYGTPVTPAGRFVVHTGANADPLSDIGAGALDNKAICLDIEADSGTLSEDFGIVCYGQAVFEANPHSDAVISSPFIFYINEDANNRDIMAIKARHNNPSSLTKMISFHDDVEPAGIIGTSGTSADNGDYMGGVEGDGSGGVDYDSSFTGKHTTVCYDDNLEEGMIVESNGEMWLNPSGKGKTQTALPKLKLSNTNDSSKVFGTLYKINEDVMMYMKYECPDGYLRVSTNSLGEGNIWITNINGDISNGDYISSSVIGGYGRKQSDDILHNYTVGKCTESIDWDSVSETITYNGVAYKKYLAACTYHCG